MGRFKVIIETDWRGDALQGFLENKEELEVKYIEDLEETWKDRGITNFMRTVINLVDQLKADSFRFETSKRDALVVMRKSFLELIEREQKTGE